MMAKHVCRIDYGTGTYPCVHTCEVCGGEELDQTTGRCLSCAELERADAKKRYVQEVSKGKHMTLRANQLYAGGEYVWAQMGSYGWSAAIVLHAGRKFLQIVFPNRAQSRRGKRTPDQLRKRDPKKNGADKPAPVGGPTEMDRASAVFRGIGL